MTAKKKATKKGPSSADSEVDVDSIVDDGSGKPLDDQSTASDVKMLPAKVTDVEDLMLGVEIAFEVVFGRLGCGGHLL